MKVAERDIGSSKLDVESNSVTDVESGESDAREVEKVKEVVEKAEDAVEKKVEIVEEIEEVTPEKIEDTKEIPEDSKTEFVAEEIAIAETVATETTMEVAAVEEVAVTEEVAIIEIVTVEEVAALIDVLECATEIAEAREEDKFTQEDVKECEETGLADIINEEGSGATVDVGPMEVGTNVETVEVVADIGFDVAIEDAAMIDVAVDVAVEDISAVDIAFADTTIADTYDSYDVYETCNAGDTYDANEAYDTYDVSAQDFYVPDVCNFDFAAVEEMAEEAEGEIEAIEEVAAEIVPEETAQDDAWEIDDTQIVDLQEITESQEEIFDANAQEEILDSQDETEDSEWILYENPEKGFKFYYPKTWTLIFDDGMKVTFDSNPDSVDDQENRIYAEVAILLNESGGSDIEFIDNLKARLVDKLDVDGTQVKIGINGTGEHLALFAVIPLNHAVVAINVWHMYPEWESISDTKNTFAKLVLSFDNM
ncbi:MAG: hypothetical protein US89_C0007G0027 [Candidatus Peregrinibacteria bacterium GW2011_GWF2_38_29]|nr:MAG: hypothetical protein US89_C0007G0027 [Candidatus Peregrinibacteria bacterium GW2011_GWF2_38_29]